MAMQMLNLTNTIIGHKDAIVRLRWMPGGQVLASASIDNTIRVWDLNSNLEIHRIAGQSRQFTEFCLTPHGRYAVTASWNDNKIEVWNFDQGTLARTLQGHTAVVNGVTVTPDGRYVVSASDDGTVRVWYLDTGQQRWVLEGHPDFAWAVTVTADSRYIISGGARDQAPIRVWDIRDGRELGSLEGHAGWVMSLKMHPDGRTLASSSDDGTIRIWDLESGETTHILTGHTAPVNAIDFSPDGRILASKSMDETVRLWRTDTWESISILNEPVSRGRGYYPNGLAFHPSAPILATLGERDSQIRVWRLDKLVSLFAGVPRTADDEERQEMGGARDIVNSHNTPTSNDILAVDSSSGSRPPDLSPPSGDQFPPSGGPPVNASGGFEPPDPPEPPHPPSGQFPFSDESDDSKRNRPEGPTARAEEFLTPQFSIYYPTRVAPNRPYALMVFAHIETFVDAVRELARAYQQIMGGQQSSGTTSSKIKVAKGTLITFIPEFKEISFTPTEQVITWGGQPYYSATFLFHAPEDIAPNLSGRVAVYQGPLILGEIPVTMTFDKQAAGSSLDGEARIEKFDPVFASYSHRDTPVMDYFRRRREEEGEKMLADIYDLRVGDHWETRLLEMIEESAVFQLFWSKHSAQSEYCRKEWQHALKFEKERPRFIRPIYWTKQLKPASPPELKHIQFYGPVSLPTTTRARMRIRRLFRR